MIWRVYCPINSHIIERWTAHIWDGGILGPNSFLVEDGMRIRSNVAAFRAGEQIAYFINMDTEPFEIITWGDQTLTFQEAEKMIRETFGEVKRWQFISPFEQLYSNLLSEGGIFFVLPSEEIR